MDTYQKWSKIDYIKAKTELELALIFITNLEFMNEFYNFIEKCFLLIFTLSKYIIIICAIFHFKMS